MRRLLRRALAPIIFACLIATLLLTVLWDRIVVIIPVGQGGVLWHVFSGGTQLQAGTLGEGVHVIAPWNKIFVYDMRLRTHTETYEVVSNDGLQIRIRMHFRWRVIPENLPLLAQTIGPEYVTKLLVPAVGSVLAEVVSEFKAEAIYSEHRETIQDRVLEQATSDRIRNGIDLYGNVDPEEDVIALVDVLIREVILPPAVQEAIQKKLSESQHVQEYVYRLEREKLEAERKAIEASGIKRFQDTVTPGMTASYLKWRGIEATQQLAESANSKIIIMGNGDKGLPVILNAGDDAVPDRPADGPRPDPADGPEVSAEVERQNREAEAATDAVARASEATQAAADAGARARAEADAQVREASETAGQPAPRFGGMIPFPPDLPLRLDPQFGQ